MRTDKEIIKQTNKLALKFYEVYGFVRDNDFKMYESTHPAEKLMWNLACHAQEMLTNTDVENCMQE